MVVKAKICVVCNGGRSTRAVVVLSRTLEKLTENSAQKSERSQVPVPLVHGLPPIGRA